MRGTEHDIFPAQFTLRPATSTTPIEEVSPYKDTPGGYHGTAGRVTVANGRVLLAVDDGHSENGPAVIINEVYTDFVPAPLRDGTSYITTAAGTTIVYVRDAACGCGSRLRSWNPLRHMQ